MYLIRGWGPKRVINRTVHCLIAWFNRRLPDCLRLSSFDSTRSFNEWWMDIWISNLTLMPPPSVPQSVTYGTGTHLPSRVAVDPGVKNEGSLSLGSPWKHKKLKTRIQHWRSFDDAHGERLTEEETDWDLALINSECLDSPSLDSSSRRWRLLDTRSSRLVYPRFCHSFSNYYQTNHPTTNTEIHTEGTLAFLSWEELIWGSKSFTKFWDSDCVSLVQTGVCFLSIIHFMVPLILPLIFSTLSEHIIILLKHLPLTPASKTDKRQKNEAKDVHKRSHKSKSQ